MSQQIINISTPDDGLGDVLRNGFDKTNQNFTELYNGKVDKVTGKGLSENDFTDADKAKLDGIETGAEVNVQADWGETDPTADSFILNKPPSLYSAFGYFHYADLDTQTTPLSLAPSDPLQLINDTLGAFTNEDQAPYGISGVWDKPTDSLDFSQLSVGDAVLFRADLSILTTSVNQNLQLYIKFGIGTPSEYDLLIDSWNEKSVVTFKHFLKDISFSIDNEDWRTAPAKIYILSDHNGSVKVNGWYIPIIRKSVNLIDFYSDPSKQDKLTEVNFGEFIYGLDSKTDIKDVDEFIISDSEDSLKSKKTRFLDLKTKLKSYFDTFYLSLSVFNDFVEDVFDSLDNKLDKSSTPSSVYATDAEGLQVMKPISEFQPVGDYVTVNTTQTVTGNKTFNNVSSINKNNTTTYPTASGGSFRIGGSGGYDNFNFYSLDGSDQDEFGVVEMYSNPEYGNVIRHTSLDNQINAILNINQYDMYLRHQYGGNITSLYVDGQNGKIKIEGTQNKFAALGTSLITGTKNFEFPNNSGTLALLSDLSGFTTPSEVATQITTAINSNKTSFTHNILVSDWTLVSGKYEAVISNAGILANSFVDVIPSNDNVDIVRSAQIYPSVLISAGSVKVYSKFLPSDTITVTININ